MYVDYNELPDNARVWIYQSNRGFTAQEKDKISEMAKAFVEQWTRHGDSVRGSFVIKYDQFLIIAVDQAFVEVSGCSIDASVNLVKKIQQVFHVDMLNKLSIAFKHGEHINTVSMGDFKKYVAEGKITADTTVFNNMIDTKQGIENTWEVPANESWHQRFFV